MPKLLNVIATCADNRVLSRDGRLPWRIRESAKFFHDQTAGQICVLGRRCFEKSPHVTCDGRQAIVLTSRLLVATRNPWHDEPDPPGPTTPPILVSSFSEALIAAETLPGEVYVCGGQQLYEETLALARPVRLHLTVVEDTGPGDTYFPEWRTAMWRELSRRESADEHHRYAFVTLER